MKSEPLVSVLMPAYNTEKYIGEAIESILDQTYTNFELIIIDDCSSDNTWDIINSYDDYKIKAYRNKKNKGISYNRNKLLELSQGKYIACLDSDDCALPKRLEKQVIFLERNKKYGLVTGDLIIINEDSKVVGKRYYPHTNKEIKKVILRYNPFAQPASMFPKKVIDDVGKYRDDIHLGEDYDLFLRIVAKYKVANINSPIIKYRISSQQTKSKHLKRTIKNTINIQEKALKEYGYSDDFFSWFYRKLLIALLTLPNKLVLIMFKLFNYKI